MDVASESEGAGWVRSVKVGTRNFGGWSRPGSKEHHGPWLAPPRGNEVKPPSTHEDQACSVFIDRTEND